ncbi:short-chain dehydrogenase/reductase SDR [Actinobacteria bacterium OK074]|nr:short-chain dehydrogenase/reductase SDR [Actinobacteria bacterium OK074]
MTTEETSFAQQYGPWAFVVGASEGVGAAYARAMAERGLNVVLLARRKDALDELAAALRTETGVETRTLAVDLTDADAMERILDGTAGLEIGMVLYCAGADPTYEPFLANPIEVPLTLVQRNCLVPMRICHHFAGLMAARGRGGIVLVSSAAGLAGARNMVAYGASKAFDMVMAEALWAELHDGGVDVLAAVLGVTDTPALRRLLARRGVLSGPDDPLPIPGAVTPEQVVAEVIENLPHGPTHFVGEPVRASERKLRGLSRNEAVKAMLAQQNASVMSGGPAAGTAP